MTEEKLHEYADKVIKELYDGSSYHEMSEVDLQTELLKDLNPDDKNHVIKFLLSESRICRRESRPEQFKSQGNISVVILDNIGLDVATKHNGSYSKYLKSIAEKERIERRTHKWTMIGSYAAIAAALIAFASLVFSIIYQCQTPTEKSTEKSVEKETRKITKKEAVEYPRNPSHANELETFSLDSVLPTEDDKAKVPKTLK